MFLSTSFSLYIHIPFCAAKCAYCDFASWPGQEGVWPGYIDRLCAEISAWRESGYVDGRDIATVFIGGGTPSILPGEMILRIMDSARALASIRPNAEITLEANPGTLTAEKLALWKAAGINRVSFGAQSFDDGLLKSLGRIHSAGEIRQAVDMARAAGFENINLDLMYALPGQTMALWEDTLAAAAALDVPHISAYSLIVEEGTPMADRVDRGLARVPDDDTVNAMQRRAVQFLQSAGLVRYEISNYARPGFESRHNLTYWRRDDYLGIGCAAHSMINRCRFANPSGLDRYLSPLPARSSGDFYRWLSDMGYQDVQPLTPEDAMEETLMLATRTTEGLDLAAWQRDFGHDLLKTRAAALDSLAHAGLVQIRNNRLTLTTHGMELQNAVVLELLG